MATYDELFNKRFGALEPLRTYEAPHHGLRVTIVTDSISSGSLYGGVATAIILGALLARRLDAGLRLVTRDRAAGVCRAERVWISSWAAAGRRTSRGSGDARCECGQVRNAAGLAHRACADSGSCGRTTLKGISQLYTAEIPPIIFSAPWERSFDQRMALGRDAAFVVRRAPDTANQQKSARLC